MKVKLGNGNDQETLDQSDNKLDGVRYEGGRSPEHIFVTLTLPGTTLTTGDDKALWGPCPAAYNGFEITDVVAGASENKGSSGTTTIQISRYRAGSQVDVLSTELTMEDEWYASDGVINTSNDDLATGDFLAIDVDAVRTGVDGVSVDIEIKKP